MMLIAACIGIGKRERFPFSVSFSVSFSIWGIVHSNFSPFLEPPPAVDLHPPPSRFPISVLFDKTEPPPDPSGGERESEHEQAATGSHDAGGDGREATPQQRYVPWCERQTESEEGGGRGHARTHASALPAHLVAAGPSGARGVEMAWRPGREGRDGVAEFPFLRTVAPRPPLAPRPIALPQRRPPMAMTLPPE